MYRFSRQDSRGIRFLVIPVPATRWRRLVPEAGRSLRGQTITCSASALSFLRPARPSARKASAIQTPVGLSETEISPNIILLSYPEG